MRVAVVGSGGVGGYLGGILASAGVDVTFIARGAHLRALRARGLRIERAQDDSLLVAPVDATDDPAEVGPVDLALLAVKSYDLAAAIEQMRPLVGQHTTVLTLQNGVEAPEQAALAFGGPAMLPGLIYSEVSLREPGVIAQGAPLVRLVFGEPDGARSTRALDIERAFADAGVDALLSENVLGALWGKFCFICAMGGVTALARRPLGPILADPEARALLLAVMREVRDVGMARGIHFDEDPVAAGLAAAERFSPSTTSSMLRDLEAGRRLEVEALNGAAVRIGRSLGVATPANHAVYAALRLAQPPQGIGV